MMVNFASGISPEGEKYWTLVGYKDFKGAIGGAGWKTFLENMGGVRMVRSGLRVCLRQWKTILLIKQKTFNFLGVLRSGTRSIRDKIQGTK